MSITRGAQQVGPGAIVGEMHVFTIGDGGLGVQGEEMGFQVFVRVPGTRSKGFEIQVIRQVRDGRFRAGYRQHVMDVRWIGNQYIMYPPISNSASLPVLRAMSEATGRIPF
jgi:hypothetical protein